MAARGGHWTKGIFRDAKGAARGKGQTPDDKLLQDRARLVAKDAQLRGGWAQTSGEARARLRARLESNLEAIRHIDRQRSALTAKSTREYNKSVAAKSTPQQQLYQAERRLRDAERALERRYSEKAYQEAQRAKRNLQKVRQQTGLR